MRRFGVCCVVLLGVACSEPAPSSSGTPACDAACAGGSRCELSSEPECEFRNPGPWFVIEAWVESEAAPLGGRGELYAFPSALGRTVTPIPISEGSLDDEFWVSWNGQWSPDGAFLVFDSCNGYDDISLECRLFTTEFGTGLPSGPHRIENLPHGVPLYAGEWAADSSAFPVTSNEEIYVVRREGNELVPSLAAAPFDVGQVFMCAGGEYVVHDDYEVAMLLRADGNSGENRRLGAPDAYYSSANVSPDGRWIATSSAIEQDDGEVVYALSLSPCGEGEDVVLAEGAPDELEGWFSPDSRYLELDVWLGPVIGYVDLQDESFGIQSYPEELAWTSAWSDSASYLLVGTPDASVFAFRPETREMVAIGAPGIAVSEDAGGDFWTLGDLVERDVRDPDTGDVTSVELYDPGLSSEPIVTFELEPGTFHSMAIDAGSTHIAIMLEHVGGAQLKIVDLRQPELVSTLLLPGAFSLWLETFSHDGRAVALTLSQPEFGLYWVSVPAPGEPPDLRVILPSEGGAYVGEQPWP